MSATWRDVYVNVLALLTSKEHKCGVVEASGIFLHYVRASVIMIARLIRQETKQLAVPC